MKLIVVSFVHIKTKVELCKRCFKVNESEFKSMAYGKCCFDRVRNDTKLTNKNFKKILKTGFCCH